jgi:hypothetical protein
MWHSGTGTCNSVELPTQRVPASTVLGCRGVQGGGALEDGQSTATHRIVVRREREGARICC